MATKPYESPDDVREALSQEIIESEDAETILVDQFNWSEDEATTAVAKWEAEDTSVEADYDDEDDTPSPEAVIERAKDRERDEEEPL